MSTQERRIGPFSSFRSLPTCLSQGLGKATKGEPCVKLRPIGNSPLRVSRGADHSKQLYQPFPLSLLACL